jgi:RNA polymerase sigma factor (sigma-70 family)
MAGSRLIVEGSLLAELQVGGRVREAAAERLYRLASTPVKRFFMHSGRLSVDQAEDVFQETMIRVIKGAGTYSGGEDAAAWIWAIARRALLDYFDITNRRSTFEVALNDEEWSDQVENRAAEALCASGQTVDECFRDGFMKFEAKMPDRAYVLDLMLDGTSVDTIAGLIGRGYDATKVYLSESRKKLGPFISHCRELLPTAG